MKKLLTTCLTLTVSMQTAFAAIDCAPYAADVRQATQQVRSFGATLESLRNEAQSAQSDLDARHSMISSAESTISSSESNIARLEGRVKQANQAISPRVKQLEGLQKNKSVLERRIEKIRADIRNLGAATTQPAGTNTGTVRVRAGTVVTPAPANSHARDTLTRELNNMLKELKSLNSQIASQERALAPELSRIQAMNNEIAQERQSQVQARAQLANAQRLKPTIQQLQQRASAANRRLHAQDQIHATNLAKLEQAQEKHLMCVTYTTKYPAVLQESKEIMKQGCRGYRMPDFGRQRDEQERHEQQAIRELLQSMCGR